MKALDDLGLWDKTKILYTEPKRYVTQRFLPMSIGVRSIYPISGFISQYSASLPTLLILFLGYEEDRAKSVYNDTEPDETILVIPRPAYNREWEGQTEEMNKRLIRVVGDKKIKYMDAIDPKKVIQELEKVRMDFPFNKWRWVILPLGTKPQAIGLYSFWRLYPNSFSIIYVQPLKHNEKFFSEGIGKTWLIKD